MSTTTSRSNRPPAGGEPEFDPTKVPVFPVLTVEVVDEHELLVDGRVEPVPPDTSATDAAVAAAADAVRRRGLDHCRVAAVVDGTTYPLVVGADGSRYDLSAPIKANRKTGATGSGSPRAWVLPVAIMIFAIVAAGVVVATVHQFRSQMAPAAAASPAAPSPTELPVLPPDGWTTHASWAVPIDSADQTTVLAHQGTVYALTGNGGTLQAYDASTGATIAQTRLDGAVKTGPMLTSIDDKTVVAIATSRYLYWRPDQPALATTQRLPLDTDAEVSFAGSSPLITLPGQHAATVVDNQLSDRTVPAGATAVRADGPTITAIDNAGHLWQLDRTQAFVPTPQATLQPPQRGQLPTVLGSTNSYVVVSWRTPGHGTGSTLTVNTLAGTTVAHRNLATVTGSDDWTAGPTLAVVDGQVLTFPSGRIVAVNDQTWRTARVVDDTIYGTINGQDAATLDPASGHAEPQAAADATAPLAADTDHAYVAADTPTGPVLYALQRR